MVHFLTCKICGKVLFSTLIKKHRIECPNTNLQEPKLQGCVVTSDDCSIN